ncbi:hypothetical protein OS493_001246 [Desmophyllum pertusum]|uniref:Beta-lactamase-related domain-containing protein n=1 Tax=Desmophyllum pertusum TaxID=174260 RepID=A0A9X0D634_9CNID|nr:hypothetical protein OS493_001246 [Desmophyllum pertusum]
MKEETGSPGVCVAVSIDGKPVWSEGFGFADIENRVLCSAKTVMRIASISKPLTATAAAKLWEEGKLDLDAPIQKYVASFPEKTFKNKTKVKDKNEKSSEPEGQVMVSTDRKQTGTMSDRCTCRQQRDAFSLEEIYIKNHYNTVTEAISLFKDEPLLSDPGTSYLYTTYGWTLLSAVIESASSQDFLLFMKKLFKDLGMENTCAEFNDKIIHNRARFYQRNNKGHLINAPYVDNSYKWGGGGFMSTVEDLVQFGNSMLYAKQMGYVNNKETFGTPEYLPGFLRPETATELWKIVANTEGKGHRDGGYGLGWVVIPEKQDFGSCYHQLDTIFHSGSAVGASSILLIRPQNAHTKPPKGVVVAVLVNLQQVHLQKTAMAVAACFEKTEL